MIFLYFSPVANIGFADPRLHHFRLHDKFTLEDFVKPHTFPLEDLVFFAQDFGEDFWFSWRKSEIESDGETPVYLYNEANRGPPPKKIAETFEEFIFEVCLGDKIDSLGLKKFYDGVSSDEESSYWSSSGDE